MKATSLAAHDTEYQEREREKDAHTHRKYEFLWRGAMVGCVAAARPGAGQPLHPVLPLLLLHGAPACSSILAQTVQLACLPRRGCSGDIRPGHPLQPPQAAARRWERPRGPVDACPPHPPRGPAHDDCLQHRRQRAVGAACHNRGVPDHGGPLRVLQVVVRGEEVTAGRNLAVRRWDHQIHPEAMGSAERQYQWDDRLFVSIRAKGTRSGCIDVWNVHFRFWH